MKFKLLLLLRRKSVSWLLTYTSIWPLRHLLLNLVIVGILLLCILTILLSFYAIILALNQLIWIAVLPREESGLSQTFASIIYNSLFWRWAFTLCKMDDALESSILTANLTANYVLLVLLLLLTGQYLFELHLLLNLLLLISENRMFRRHLLSSISYLLGTNDIHAQSLLVFRRRTLDRIGIRSRVCSVSISVCHVVSRLLLGPRYSDHWLCIWWWILIRVKVRIRHTLIVRLYVVVLIRIYTVTYLVYTLTRACTPVHTLSVWY